MSVSLYTSIVPGQVWRCHELHDREGQLMRIRELKFFGGTLNVIYDWQDGKSGHTDEPNGIRTWCNLEHGVAFVRVRKKPLSLEQRRDLFIDIMKSRGVPSALAPGLPIHRGRL